MAKGTWQSGRCSHLQPWGHRFQVISLIFSTTTTTTNNNDDDDDKNKEYG